MPIPEDVANWILNLPDYFDLELEKESKNSFSDEIAVAAYLSDPKKREKYLAERRRAEYMLNALTHPKKAKRLLLLPDEKVPVDLEEAFQACLQSETKITQKPSSVLDKLEAYEQSFERANSLPSQSFFQTAYSATQAAVSTTTQYVSYFFQPAKPAATKDLVNLEILPTASGNGVEVVISLAGKKI